MTDADKITEELEGLGGRLKELTLARVEGVVELTAEQVVDFADLADDVALALAGDERAKAHAAAQFKLAKFSTEARAYMEAAEFREAFADVVEEVGGKLLTVGSKVAAEFLVGLLRGALGG